MGISKNVEVALKVLVIKMTSTKIGIFTVS